MKSTSALKRKVDELQKQAEEIEELGIKVLEEAPFRNASDGGFFTSLSYQNPIKKIQREVIQKYQQWYSICCQLIDEYNPEWRNRFKSYYTDNSRISLSGGVMDFLSLEVFAHFSDRGKGVTEFVDGLETQLAILMSIPSVVEVKEISLRKLITADIARTEIEQAEILLESGFERAAGSIAGVALELYLKTQCDVNGISYPTKPTIEPLIQALYIAERLDISEKKHLEYLGSIRNKCSHSEPITEKEVKRLIEEVKKLI